MSEHMASNHHDDLSKLTIELSSGELIEVAPHNTALFQFTGEAASRDHVFFYTATNNGDIESARLFKTFDPNTYDDLRRHILFDVEYEASLSDEVPQGDEKAYQQEVNSHVESWRKKIPNTVIDFLITTALK